ncbi:hypothetical protein [Sediminibacillus terrae]|uniref:hypothetical protein n=1 Tax=Sediminibacillus terrae TaxID=1562106 RepID=UPI001297D4F0|nr:hypothetical protein [Sediminibacillus terrae]
MDGALPSFELNRLDEVLFCRVRPQFKLINRMKPFRSPSLHLEKEKPAGIKATEKVLSNLEEILKFVVDSHESLIVESTVGKRKRSDLL